MSPTPHISAIICTYNRCRLLSAAIESLADQTLDNRDFEVVVVDNASTDQTGEVVAECQRRFSDCQIRLIREEKQGLSHARNTGFRIAHGKYVAYLDDDATAVACWLEAGLTSFEQSCPKPLAVVGPVNPVYPEGKPTWFNDRFESYDLGTSPVQLTREQSFMGGNAMFDKDVLDVLNGFDPNLGMNGSRLWLGEEVDLLLRMRQHFGDACCVYYEPQVRIDHAVPMAKLRVAYILRRRFLNGQCKHFMQMQKGRLGQVVRSLSWITWLSLSAIAHSTGYRSLRAWLTERGAPLAVHLGMLTANLRGLPKPADSTPIETETDIRKAA